MTENQAFETLHSASRENAPSVAERKKYLSIIKDGILLNENKIYDALFSDLRKPKLETYLSEIYFTIQCIDLLIKHIDSWAKSTSIGTTFNNFPSKNWIQPTPKGVVLVIATWNYPFHLSMAPVIECIGAGNRVILKPSELAPETSKLLLRMSKECALPNVFQVIEGGKEQTHNLASLPFDHVFFTGGSTVGKIIAAKAAEHLTPVTLELGGKNPCIVDDTVDLRLSAKRILSSKFFNAGQTCIAPDFVWVQESIAPKFIELCQSLLREFYPSQESWKKDSARIINQQHYENLLKLISNQTWNLYSSDATTLHIAPTLLLNVKWDHPSMQQEIFGPILPIMTFNSLNEVVDKIREESPLALYLFSQNKDSQELIIKNSRSGGVCINDCMKQFTNLGLPFGGIGQSGYGAYHAKAGFDTFSHMRSITRKSFWWDKFNAYPPYDKIFSRIRKFVR